MMFLVKCYLIAIVVFILITGMALGCCDDLPWKWLNILCQAILMGIILFMILSFLALLVGAALKGTL